MKARAKKPIRRGRARPGALDAADRASVFEYGLELPMKILANAIELQRVLVAIERTVRARESSLSASEKERRFVAELAGADLDPSLAILEKASARLDELQRASGRVGANGRAVRRAPRTIEEMLEARVNAIPRVAEIRSSLTVAKLDERSRQLEFALRENARALAKAFGESGRKHVLWQRIGAWDAVLRAIHPRKGSVWRDSLVAKNLRLGNESTLRTFRRRRATK